VSIAVPVPRSTPPPRPTPTEETLTVQSAQAGDVDARELLARTYQRTAYLFALQLTGHPDDALDLAQEAMLRFFRTLGRFDAERPVRPWLLRIVRNLVRDRARRLRVRRHVPLQPNPEVLATDPPDPSPSPEDRAATTELQLLLWRALRRLPPQFREIVSLRDYLGLSYREIAEALRIPTGTVMSRLHRARSMLREEVRRSMRGEVQHD
jgi:RNA polymerase sigma-70 factor (ECF subfamily)